MVIGTFAYANNSVSNFVDTVVEIEGMCHYTIVKVIFHPDGTTTTKETDHVTRADSQKDCEDKANKHARDLNNDI